MTPSRPTWRLNKTSGGECAGAQPRLFGVDYAPEAYGSGAIIAGGHHEQLAVLVVAVGLREIPDGA